MTGLTAKLFHRRSQSRSPDPTKADYLATDEKGSQTTITPSTSSTPPQTFGVAFSAQEKGLQIWTPSTNPATSPAYSLRTAGNLVELWKGTDITAPPIGSAHLSKNGKTAELLLHINDERFEMKTSQMTGASTCTHPLLGSLKWKTSMTTGLASELQRVGDGSVVAKFVAIRWSRKGPKELQILAPGLDEETVEFVVLFGRAARFASQRFMETVAVAAAVS